MKKLGLILLSSASLFLFIFSSCRMGCIRGSGNMATENRKPGSFTKLDIEGGYNLVLKQDGSHNVTVTADDNLLKYIHTTITGNMLRIYSRKNFCNSHPITVTVGLSDLELLRTSGAVEASNVGKLNVKDLRLDLSGASKITLNLNATHLVTEGSGSTEVHLTGQAASHKIDLSGSGKIYAFDFVTGDCEVHTAGADDIEINVLHSLKTNTTGASDIKYKGSPETVQTEKAGASSVEKVN